MLIAIVYKAYLTQKHHPLAVFFIPALVLKLISGVALGLLYFYYYGYGDTILYFRDTSALADLFYQSPKKYLEYLVNAYQVDLYYHDNPRALFFIKLISPFVIITYKNYWLSTLYIALLSFLSTWYLVKNISLFYRKLIIGAVVGFLFLPSVVFWSSGFIKESVSISILSILVAWFIQMINRKGERATLKILLAIVLLYILYSLKYYYAAVLMLTVLPILMMDAISIRTPIKYPIFSWLVLLVLVLFTVSSLHPNLNLDNVLQVIVENNRLYEQHHILAKTINYCNLKPTFWSIVINTPLAILSAWFRPLFINAGSWLQYLLSMENLMLLVLSVSFFTKRHSLKKEFVPHVLSWISFILILTVLLAISTPNFGTLSRYRISFLPFLVMLWSYDNPIVLKMIQFLKERFGVNSSHF